MPYSQTILISLMHPLSLCDRQLTDCKKTPVNIVATNILSIGFKYTLRSL